MSISNKQQALQTAFNDAFISLNAAQKQAVNTIEGPVLVIAGPGTGKTQILTLRIANILLMTDTKPEQILALTFTESGAKAMRDRLRRYVGAAAYRVSIHTFHSFAGRLISEYPDAYPSIIGGRPGSDIDKINIIENILEHSNFKLLRPSGNPRYYVTPLLHIIGTLKQENISPDRLVEIIATQEANLQDTPKLHAKGAHKGKVRGDYTKLEKTIAKNRELAHVYRQYEALLGEQNLFDFNDMIKQTVAALTNDIDMLRDLQEQFQYVLADEHQDVNGAQNKILELLASYHSAPNIFAVGDEKQAIYRFQGASLQNFLHFENAFTGTTAIALTENYRSGQTILDLAHSLIKVGDGPLQGLRVPLEAKAVAQSTVEERAFSHQAIEDAWLIQSIQEQINAGTPLSEIAVIVRTNKEVEILAALLRKANIKANASASGDILKHSITQAVQALLRAVLTDKDEEALFTILHGAYWGLSSSDLVRIYGARRHNLSLQMILRDTSLLRALGVEAPDTALNIINVLTEARAREVTDPPHRVLEYLLNASGFLEHVMRYDPLEGVRVLRRLYDEIEALVVTDDITTLARVCELLTLRSDYGLPLNAPYLHNGGEAITVMTAHKSKGLEFDTVYIPRLIDAVWGGATRRELFKIPLATISTTTPDDQNDDEKRLLYVAMTRAKTKLYISYSDTNAEGKELLASRLLIELDRSLVSVVDTTSFENGYQISDTLQPGIRGVTVDTQLLTELLALRGFSATSINNYLRNPWDYFYRNILRVPQVQPTHMQFGTAIHNTLEKITRQHTKDKKLPNENQILAWYEHELSTLPVSKNEYDRLREQGAETLLTYLNHLEKTLPAITYEELNIKVVLKTGLAALPEIMLTGKLDRLDMALDGTALQVVDYKTGKPKTRNAIEGKNAGGDGGYKRQLVFYALLLSLYEHEQFITKTGVLSFVQADSKGCIKEECFSITNEEIEGLKKDIIAAVADITTGAFLSDELAASESEYAHLIPWLRR